MTDRLRHLRYDVFTDVAYAGNPLAVVVDPPVLDDRQRQQIAAEFNLSETVFLTETDRGWDTRIFTPAEELPFAGHPTIGAALALVDLGRISDSVTLLEKVGPVVVTIDDGLATLTTPVPPAPVLAADPGDIVAALGLTMGDLHRELGPRAWSAGVPYTMVTLGSVEDLARIRLDLSVWADTLEHGAAPAIYVLAPVEKIRGRHWRARMFAPGIGIVEDPATGSAAAAACGYLAANAGTERLAEGWLIRQGVEMGRPSDIHLGAVLDHGELVAATVGGRAVAVGAGDLVVPGR